MKSFNKLALATAVAATMPIGFSPIAQAAVGIEEVVVTARKRDEVIQDVPVAITAVTTEQLDRGVITNFEEATKLTPGFSAPQASSSPTALALSMRGSVQNDVVITTDPSVGAYVDGIYIARAYGIGMDLLDLADIQVLKGPQGTLFGRNTTAGALLLNTKNPELNQFTGQVTLTAGPEYKKEVGIVNIPIFDTMALRLAASDAERDDYVDNKAIPQTGTINPALKSWDTKLGGRETSTYRAKFRWMPTDQLDMVLAYDRFHIGDRTAGVQKWLQGSERPHKPDVVNLNFDNYNASDTDTLTFVGTYSADDWELKFLASDRNWRDLREMDYDGGNLAGITRHGSWGREAGDQQSYELQFNTNLFNDAVELVSGVLYFKEFGQLYDYSYGFNPFVTTPAIVGGNYMEQDVTSKGIYAQATWHLTDVSNLTVGVRESKDDKSAHLYGASEARTTRLPSWDFNAHKNSLFDGGGTALTNPHFGRPVYQQTPSKSFSAFNWMASYDYKIMDEVLVYGKVSTGFRAGGFNGRGVTTDASGNAILPLIFDPEKVTEIEFGAKGDFLDRRLRWNTAIYANETKDKQLTTILNSTNGGTPGTSIANAGRAESKGFETELTYLVTDNWKINASYAYIDAEVKEKKQQGVKLPSDELPNLQYVPENQWSLGVSYDQEFETFKLAGTANYSWIDEMASQDKTPTTAFKDAGSGVGANSLTMAQAASFVDAAKSDAFGLLNLSMTVSPLDDKYSFTLWVKNALDERAISSTIGFISGTTYQYVRGVYTEPRTWGGTVTVNF
jgi:iron complex outermembrane receptor protein